MRITLLHILLIGITVSSAHGETKCYAVQHQDHDEAVCIGDEKRIPEKNVLSQPVQPATVLPENKSRQEVPAVTAPVVNTPATIPARDGSRPHVTSSTPDSAAQLARRKAIAIRNSQRLNGKVSQQEPVSELPQKLQ